MLKPPLVFLHVAMLVDDPIVSWPELGQVHDVDAEEVIKTYENLGCPWPSQVPSVVSVPEGSEHALYLLEGEMTRHDVLVVSVRKSPGAHRSWWARLEDAAKEVGVQVVEHARHDVLEAIAYRQFAEGLRALEDSADLLRSPGIDSSTEAMRTETALTRAIQAVKATGFRAPRKR